MRGVLLVVLMLCGACAPDQGAETHQSSSCPAPLPQGNGAINDSQCDASLHEHMTYKYAGSMLNLNDEARIAVQDSYTGLWGTMSFGWVYCDDHTNDFTPGTYTLPSNDECAGFVDFRPGKSSNADDAFLERGGLPAYLLRNDDPKGACTLTVSTRSHGYVGGSVLCTDLPELFGLNEAFGPRIDRIEYTFAFSDIADDPWPAQ